MRSLSTYRTVSMQSIQLVHALARAIAALRWFLLAASLHSSLLADLIGLMDTTAALHTSLYCVRSTLR